jgi:DNA (cytosine-5)-methyltransferase 1
MIELTVDNFAGGGGASFGIEAALGRPIDFAINHDREAIAMHAANHPRTKHYCEDVWQVDPMEVTGGKPVGLAWFSPDCKHFSRAKGGKPVSKRVRGLAWIVIRWAKAVRPRVIMLENVSEFATWGPLLEDGSPCKIRKGFTFRRWCKMLENLGYRIDMREMSACDYGAPTVRRRLFIIARCDGRPIVWPQETHGRGLLPYRTAAECIDWSIPCPSIFERSKPLADATLRRIARGITRYVVNNPKPFIVQMRGTESSQIDCSARPMDVPLGTVSAGGIHHALVTPIIAGCGGRMGQSLERPVDGPFQTITSKADAVLVTPIIAPLTHQGDRRAHSLAEPLPTITGAHRGELALIAPTLINTRNGEREGQAPRVRDIQEPAPTVTAKGSQGALVAAFLARHYGGHENDGAPMAHPMYTVTTQDHHALVHAFLIKYFGKGTGQEITSPLATITAKDRFGLVTVMGDKYYIADIGMRMLVPRELFNAQSFPPDYTIDPIVDGKPLTKTAQVRMAGNSVCPVMAEALVRANVVEQSAVEVA